MKANATAQVERTDSQLDDRTLAALTERMVAYETAPGQHRVVGENHGRRDADEYTVDTRLGVCDCADYQYREPEGGCKHIRRVRLSIGEVPIPAGVENVDPALGQATDGEPRRVATDGGSAEWTERAREMAAKVNDRAGQRQRVPVDGGVLVYELDVHGRELVGFEDVTDWDRLSDAVAAKGHDRGDVLHLPELDG